ncbi:MAG: TonB-dependent receptor [Opitutae bacterium]|nr:TonB-dependent receptor [Opitutae bacterium]
MKKLPSSYLLTAALAAAFAVAPLPAQTARPSPDQPAAPAAEQPIVLETFTVTGSNIRRVDAETALPVLVIDMTDVNMRNGSTMADLFETITIAEASGLNESNTGPQGARGDVNSIDLRGIGSGSTLTLLNSRRYAPHPISMAENGVPSLAPNANALPTAFSSRIEILRDGASAIYGSDAAAGVINTIISPTAEGSRVRARVAMTQHGGANEYQFSASQAFKRGKTHLSTSITFSHRDALSATDRFWASQMDLRLARELPAPWNGIPVVANGVTQSRDNDFANTNAVNQYGQWQRGFINQSDWRTFTGSRPELNAGISTSTAPTPGVATMDATGMFYFWPSPAGTLAWKQSAPSKNIDNVENATYSNWAKWRILTPRSDRVNIATFANHKINDRMEFFGDFFYYGARSVSGREPINFDNVDEPGIYVPASNPWNPFGTRFYDVNGAPNADGTPRLKGTPADVAMIGGVTPVEFKARVIEVKSSLVRGLAGVRGKFGDTWQWESAMLYSGAQTHEYEHFYVRESRLRMALNRTDGSALNPFGYTFKIVNNQIVSDKPYVNPDMVIDPLYCDDERYGRTKLFVWDAKANGELFQLFGGGNASLAAGAEVRWESYDDKRPIYSGMNPPGSENMPYIRAEDNDIIALSPNKAISAAQTIYACYSEVALPFVTAANRRLLLHGLELTLAGRFEHFSIHGQTTKPKASLVWKPAPWLKLRGAIHESFRAPNIVQTNVTALRRSVAGTDDYRFDVTGLGNPDGNVNRLAYRMGNSDLKPEVAKSWVAGFVLDVPKVRGLAFTFDYWRLNQNDVIDNIGTPGTLDRDALYLQLATQAALAAGTPIDKIDLGSGTANYKGYRYVTRKPVTDADRALFAAYNAKQPTTATMRAPVGDFVSLIDNYINLGGRDLEGYEIGMQYRLPKMRIGQFTVKGESTHYLRRESKGEENAPVLNELNKNGRAAWRANASLTWKRNAWSAGWNTTYYHSFVDTSAATTQVIWEALGRPKHIQEYYDNGIMRYVLRVKPVYMHNAFVGYRFGRSAHRWVRGMNVSVGVNNVLDVEPSISDETQGTGYLGGITNTRGRMFTFDVTQSF